jgi:hypothetical protein
MPLSGVLHMLKRPSSSYYQAVSYIHLGIAKSHALVGLSLQAHV